MNEIVEIRRHGRGGQGVINLIRAESAKSFYN